MSICFRRHGENEVRQVHQYQGHSSWWNRAGSLSPSLVFQRDGCSTARWLWWTCTTTMRWTSVLWKRRTWVCLSIGCDADCWKSRVSPLLISFTLFRETHFLKLWRCDFTTSPMTLVQDSRFIVAGRAKPRGTPGFHGPRLTCVVACSVQATLMNPQDNIIALKAVCSPYK